MHRNTSPAVFFSYLFHSSRLSWGTGLNRRQKSATCPQANRDVYAQKQTHTYTHECGHIHTHTCTHTHADNDNVPRQVTSYKTTSTTMDNTGRVESNSQVENQYCKHGLVSIESMTTSVVFFSTVSTSTS